MAVRPCVLAQKLNSGGYVEAEDRGRNIWGLGYAFAAGIPRLYLELQILQNIAPLPKKCIGSDKSKPVVLIELFEFSPNMTFRLHPK